AIPGADGGGVGLRTVAFLLPLGCCCRTISETPLPDDEGVIPRRGPCDATCATVPAGADAAGCVCAYPASGQPVAGRLPSGPQLRAALRPGLPLSASRLGGAAHRG